MIKKISFWICALLGYILFFRFTLALCALTLEKIITNVFFLNALVFLLLFSLPPLLTTLAMRWLRQRFPH